MRKGEVGTSEAEVGSGREVQEVRIYQGDEALAWSPRELAVFATADLVSQLPLPNQDGN